jgi:hypothetical protein
MQAPWWCHFHEAHSLIGPWFNAVTKS